MAFEIPMSMEKMSFWMSMEIGGVESSVFHLKVLTIRSWSSQKGPKVSEQFKRKIFEYHPMNFQLFSIVFRINQFEICEAIISSNAPSSITLPTVSPNNFLEDGEIQRQKPLINRSLIKFFRLSLLNLFVWFYIIFWWKTREF